MRTKYLLTSLWKTRRARWNMTHMDCGIDRVANACSFISTCSDAFALKHFLSLTYFKLRNSVFAFFNEVLFASDEHLWCFVVDCSCLVCPLILRILEWDAVVKSEADHKGVEALELLDHEAFNSLKHDLLAANVYDFQIILDPLKFDLAFVEV